MELLKVIKFEGDDNTIVYKHPAEDFNTQSQLIVHQSQEAIFFKDGEALDLFGPGRYTLNTQNIPILRNIINIPTEGVSPFHCEVYFINKVMTFNTEWGTSNRFEILDPTFGVPLSIGASGTIEFKIFDSRKFLVNVVGTQEELSKNDLIRYFKGKIVTKVKSYLARILNEISYLNVTAHLDELSEALKNELKNYFEEFGIELHNFYISNVIIPKKESKQLKKVLNKKLEYGTLDYSWADEQIAEISKKYAENPGHNDGVSGMITEIPLAFAFGQMLKDNMLVNLSQPFEDKTQAFNSKPNSNSNNENNDFCFKCGAKLKEGSLFCSKCGTNLNTNLTCEKCGNEISDDDVFCNKCGYKLK